MFEISIDTGGTFTDGLLIDEEGRLSIAKTPTIVDDPSAGVMECITLLARERGMTLKKLLPKVSTLLTATTLATNAALELKGAKVCMITTKGFRDILEWRRVVKPDLFNLKMPQPTILVPRYLRFGVEERTIVTGEIITPLNEDEVRQAANKARAYNAEVVAICFLHSYINPKHEQKAAEIVRAEYPEAEVVLSSSVLPRPMEFERFSTTVLAGYVKPICSRFMKGFSQRLKDAGFKGVLLFMTSNAAVATPEVISERPIAILGSGPSAGPLMATFLGKSCGFEDIISCDMGGTSFDVSIIPGGRILTTTEGMIGDQRNAYETTDVTSIGAGGGSIVWIDQRGVLRVGPGSAGADPGPACYGKGGQKPTVTDADVVLGYISADYFLGGKVKLDKSLAEKAIKEEIANPLGMDTIEAAYAIRSLTDFVLADRVFMTAVRRGYDPRRFTLCVGGGAGPTHGISVASRLGIKEVYIPKLAPVFCASGMIGADFSHSFTRPASYRGKDVDLNEMDKIYKKMETDGVTLLARQGVSREAMKIRRGAEMRYYGQIHDCEATMPEVKPDTPVSRESFEALIKDFHNRHKEIYGYSDETALTHITVLKLTAIGTRRPIKMVEQPTSGEDPSEALKGKRSIYFKEEKGSLETPCYDGDKLRHGNVITGPAIVEEKMTTVVIPPEAKVRVDSHGNYVAKLL